MTQYTGKLCRLAKTCNFGAYLEIALCDQFVCGLANVKCQQELLYEANLTVEIALKKARAVEVVLKETEGIQACKRDISESYSLIQATNTSKNTKQVCF